MLKTLLTRALFYKKCLKLGSREYPIKRKELREKEFGSCSNNNGQGRPTESV